MTLPVIIKAGSVTVAGGGGGGSAAGAAVAAGEAPPGGAAHFDVKAIQDEDLDTLGELMNINHGMLNALQVSTPELEQLVEIARKNGALGAKLTGGGGGGSVIAVCDGSNESMVSAIRDAGFQAIPVNLGATLDGS